MEQWHIGPVPEYVYPSNTQNDMHGSHNYRPEMQRTGERMDFPYGTAQPNMAPPGQTPLNPQQQQQQQQQQQRQQQQPAAASSTTPQAQTPTQSSTPQNRNRKRPAPGTAPIPSPVPANATTPATSQASASAAPTQSPNPAPPVPPATTPVVPPVKDEGAATPTPAPPAKKSRTNTPWTPEEEQRLKIMRDQGNSWAAIAKAFPSRTEGSVKKHWYKDMHYAEFAEDEHQALAAAIKEYENNKWKVIGQKLGKPAKACEQYAKEKLADILSNPKRG